MEQYAVTSSNFIGEAYYTFDEHGRLQAMSFLNVVDPTTHARLCANVPVTKATLMAWKESPTTKMIISEVEPDLTFENFWKRYNYFEGKKAAQKAWERLSKANKIKALAYIPVYFKKIAASGAAKAYAATYLNQERWNDAA